MTKIYKITNLINGKCYIGLTKRRLSVRFWEHMKPSRTRVSAVSKAIQKYGKENFKIELLIETKVPSLMEMYYIRMFNTISPFGYNLTYGGENLVLTDESIKKGANTRRGQPSKLRGRKQDTDWVKKRVKNRIKPVIGTKIDSGHTVEFEGAAEMVKNGVGPSAIFECCNGRQFQAYGYIWVFKNDSDKKPPYTQKGPSKKRKYKDIIKIA